MKFLKKQETHITSLYKWMENSIDISSHEILRIIFNKNENAVVYVSPLSMSPQK